MTVVMTAARTLNEAVSQDGSPNDVYASVLSTARDMGWEKLRGRWAQARQRGATDSFTFARDAAHIAPVPTDWLPRIIPADHWAHISAGVAQRLRSLNRFLKDVYCGDQSIVPGEVIKSGRYYQPGVEGIVPPKDVYCHIYGIDLVHMGGGKYAVLEDNLRVPSGITYQMKCLEIGAECLPEFREGYSIQPYEIAPTYRRLFASLAGADRPNAVLLTDGKHGSAFFEHRYLSEHLGIALVEGSDLFVDEGYNVFCRTLTGAQPVHVIYRRVEDLEDFAPGLTEAYARGKVALINAPGAGAADDKLVFLWVPQMIEHYLGEEPVLYQARSYYPDKDDDYAYIQENIERMVLKTRDGYGGLGVYIMPDLSDELRAAAARALRQRKGAFIAQEMLDFSRHLVLSEDQTDFDERYIDLRVYAVQDGDGNVTVFPGGLTRVARAGSRVTNNSSGGACKETWVAN